MPKKMERTYPNASGGWHGCPMTCPDFCPFEDCTMPGDVATAYEPKHWHGWMVNKDGNVVSDKAFDSWVDAWNEKESRLIHEN